MGLLSAGKPLSWPETKKNTHIVHKIGIQQFLSLYHKQKGRKDTLKWGDEIEYTLLKFDHKAEKVQLSLLGPTILDTLQQPENSDPIHHQTKWRPEYASFMIEGTPGATPYGGCYLHFNQVEANLRLRRQQLAEVLKDTDTDALCLTAFARVGCPRFTSPEYDPKEDGAVSNSLFFPDSAIWSGHPRFKTLTRNIRERRGDNPAINIPVFKDEHTPSPFVEVFPNDDQGTAAWGALPDHIYMDCMGFGMGLSCLQVTFQACDIDEARHLYDQLSILCPMMVSISVATCIHRGLLADLDCRFAVIEHSVDDRTEEERGLKPLKEDKFVIPNSRYSGIDCYLASEDYNDVELVYNQEHFETLKSGGVDDLLAKHIAHLFIRDPISLFAEKLQQDPDNETDHFENIQSTNWQSMRFKPPPSHDSPIGWRVEFRPLDLSLTDFENAALVVFLVLVTRAILSFRLNFYIPMSKAKENLKRAQMRDAVNSQKFYFRKSVVPEDEEEEAKDHPPQSHDHEYTEMSINTIFNGKDEFPGLIPLVRMYVNSVDMDVDTRCTVLNYLRYISKKASGELMTTASWIRKFVASHPDYKQDSVVSEKITYDLYKEMKKISDGEITCPKLTGNLASKSPEKYKVIDCPPDSAK